MLSLDDVPVALLTVAPGGRVTAANARCQELFGGDVTGVAAAALLPDGIPARGRARVTAMRAGDVPVTVDLAVTDAGGGRVVVLTEVEGLRLLEEADAMMAAAFDTVPLGMALYDTRGEFIRVNRAMCALLARRPEDLLGRRDQDLTHPDDRAADLAAAARILDGSTDSHQCEKRFLRPDGQVVWALANLAFLRDGSGNPLCWVGTFQDVTSRKRSEHRLRHLADHDPLTGVANRRRLVSDLARRLVHAGRDGERGAVLVLDLDGFKAINDTQGHEAGDELLSTVAVALRQRLRATDAVGRLGGDEFAVVLAHVDGPTAGAIAGELLEAVAAASPNRVTASCGVATYGPEERVGVDELLSRADRAMYAAKRSGRGVAMQAGEADANATPVPG